MCLSEFWDDRNDAELKNESSSKYYKMEQLPYYTIVQCGVAFISFIKAM